MTPNKGITIRLRIIYAGAILLSLMVLGRAFDIGILNRNHWLSQKKNKIKLDTIPALRGNILAADGTPLAASIPQYTLRLDFSVKKLRKNFPDKVDSLVNAMAKLFPDIKRGELLASLNKAYRAKPRVFTLRKNLSHTELKTMYTFPLLRDKAKGGVIQESIDKRINPLRNLALATIGKVNALEQAYGLESNYQQELHGKDGIRLQKLLSGNIWTTVDENVGVEPQEGSDLYTALDVQLQDVAENALRNQLRINNADRGCVILMEVKTGYIRAMANLSRSGKDSLNYFEGDNLAVSAAWDPGSTFKLASVMALIEDGLADTTDLVDTQGGRYHIKGHTITDSKPGGYGVIPLAEAFTESSNVGIIKAVMKGYQRNPGKFLARLKAFNIGTKSGIDLADAELQPVMYHPGHKKWSDLSLPMLAMGYEILMPPIQMLGFYNAVANGGVYVKPQLVTEIRNNGRVTRRFNPQVVDSSICSAATLKKVMPLLKGVVQRGTGSKLKNPYYQIAGKTGTVRKSYKREGMEIKNYRASFAGFFPYDNPQYSCIVVIENPTRDGYYGGTVAAPVFKDLADKVFARDKEMQKAFHRSQLADNELVPTAGYGDDFRVISHSLKARLKGTEAEWVHGSKSMAVDLTRDALNTMPDVTGMGLRDALFLLENMGLNVVPKGRGRVSKQSIPAGTPVRKYSTVNLELV